MPVGDRATLQHQPALGPVGVGHLPDQPRLADARLADQRRDLPVTGPARSSARVERGHLGIPADEAGQTPRGRHLEARPGVPAPSSSNDLDRLGQPLDRDRPERADLDVPLHQRERARPSAGRVPARASCSIREARWTVWPIAV